MTTREDFLDEGESEVERATVGWRPFGGRPAIARATGWLTRECGAAFLDALAAAARAADGSADIAAVLQEWADTDRRFVETCGEGPLPLHGVPELENDLRTANEATLILLSRAVRAEAVCNAIEAHVSHGGSIPWPSIRKPYDAWLRARDGGEW